MKNSYHFAKRIPVRGPQDAACETQTTETVEVLQIGAGKDRPMVVFIKRVNIVSPICRVMLGEDHNVMQRMVVGVGVMSLGVLIAQTVGHHHNAVVSHIGDALGYGLHGLGLTPFVEYLASKYGKKHEA